MTVPSEHAQSPPRSTEPPQEGRIYRGLFRGIFSGMDPETAHRWVVTGLRAAHRMGVLAPVERLTRPAPELAVEALGRRWPSPFGLAAGFDKGAVAVLPLAALGFGHIEIGTVTASPQPGNDRPRLIRLIADRALINRMGFNNDGAEVVAARLQRLRARIDRRRAAGQHAPVLGVNIGKTKVTPLEEATEDYLVSTWALAPWADYLVVNVSSPNTPGLRQLQEIDSLRPLLAAVREAAHQAAGRAVPLLVKIAPDLADEDVDAVADLAAELPLDGIIATNTTTTRHGLKTSAAKITKAGAGGLSGPVLAARSIQVLQRLRARLPESTAVISVGGVETAEDVVERLELGADLVQGYTGFIYAGPLWVHRINRGLIRRRRRA